MPTARHSACDSGITDKFDLLHIRSELARNSGRKKNSGISSLTSVADSEDESHHVVSSLRNVLSAMSKLPPTYTQIHKHKHLLNKYNFMCTKKRQ